MKVNWDGNACCHSGNCVKSLPEVFAVEDGQFVSRPENAPAERVREIVAACPGNALSIEEQ
jgi:uncharacterized Fe-S cluster protein YjdI